MAWLEPLPEARRVGRHRRRVHLHRPGRRLARGARLPGAAGRRRSPPRDRARSRSPPTAARARPRSRRPTPTSSRRSSARSRRTRPTNAVNVDVPTGSADGADRRRAGADDHLLGHQPGRATCRPGCSPSSSTRPPGIVLGNQVTPDRRHPRRPEPHAHPAARAGRLRHQGRRQGHRCSSWPSPPATPRPASAARRLHQDRHHPPHRRHRPRLTAHPGRLVPPGPHLTFAR